MGEPERRVLRRKRQQIVCNIGDPQQVIQHLHSDGVLTDAYVEMLQADRLDSEHLSKLVDILCLQCPAAFDSLCRLLEDHSPWLRDDLIAEVRAESGTLHIDDDIQQEAAELVHHHFGTSRRFSQADKREIAYIIATKAQIAKETWRRHLSKISIDLDKAKEVLHHMESQITELNSKIKCFVRQNEFFQSDSLLDTKSTSDVLFAREPRKEEPVEELSKRVDFLIGKILRSMTLTEKVSTTRRGQLQSLSTLDDNTYVDSLKRKIGVLEEEVKRQIDVVERQKLVIQQKESEVISLKERIEQLVQSSLAETETETVTVVPLALEQNAAKPVPILPPIKSSPATVSRAMTSRPHRCDRKCLNGKKR